METHMKNDDDFLASLERAVRGAPTALEEACVGVSPSTKGDIAKKTIGKTNENRTASRKRTQKKPPPRGGPPAPATKMSGAEARSGRSTNTSGLTPLNGARRRKQVAVEVDEAEIDKRIDRVAKRVAKCLGSAAAKRQTTDAEERKKLYELVVGVLYDGDYHAYAHPGSKGLSLRRLCEHPMLEKIPESRSAISRAVTARRVELTLEDAGVPARGRLSTRHLAMLHGLRDHSEVMMEVAKTATEEEMSTRDLSALIQERRPRVKGNDQPLKGTLLGEARRLRALADDARERAAKARQPADRAAWDESKLEAIVADADAVRRWLDAVMVEVTRLRDAKELASTEASHPTDAEGSRS